jgi:hypothetical protein
VSRKREPVAEIGHENYRVVRHTHDIELAKKLMHAKISADLGSRYDGELGEPRQVWMRITYCLPNSYGAGEGWRIEYREGARGRGAFPAVVFQ